MYLYFIALLALVQGITEFLPISSSGHLVLLHSFDPNRSGEDIWETELALDISLHLGTLLAALLYFYKDILNMVLGTLSSVVERKSNQGLKVGLSVILASIPVIIVGLVLTFWEPSWLRSVQVIGWTSIIFGVLLWAADKYFPNTKAVETISYKDAFLIGLSQCVALIPGVSRSGITMTAGRALGFTRTEAARFSLLLSIVAISGAGTLQSLKLLDEKIDIDFAEMGIGFGLSFAFGFAAIYLMMKWLSKASFTPFVIYRVLLGVVLLGLFYTGIIS